MSFESFDVPWFVDASSVCSQYWFSSGLLHRYHFLVSKFGPVFVSIFPVVFPQNFPLVSRVIGKIGNPNRKN